MKAGFDAQGYVYARYGNSTVSALEQAVAGLEEGETALAFASGVGRGGPPARGSPAGGQHLRQSLPGAAPEAGGRRRKVCDLPTSSTAPPGTWEATATFWAES